MYSEKLQDTREGRSRLQSKEGEGSERDMYVKNPWTKNKRAGGRIESRRWGVGRAGESNLGKMRTTIIEQ